MKKILLATALAGISATSAFAADMAVKAPMYAKAPISPAYNWTGFYAGLNAGGVWGDSNISASADPGFIFQITPINQSSSGHLRPNGFIGGGQAGYNWQSGTFVFGIEGDVQYQSLKKDVIYAPLVAGSGGSGEHTFRSDFLMTLRPRLGFTVAPNILLYGTGGLAVGTMSIYDAVTGSPPVTEADSISKTKAGWTAGGGVEWALAANWTVKAEYLYVDLGKTSHSTPTFPIAPLTGVLFDQHFTEQVARIGVNYKFGGPVVANY